MARLRDNTPRPSCPKCRVPAKKNGCTKAGKQRFRCAICGSMIPINAELSEPYLQEETEGRFKPAQGYENFALFVLTGHFPKRYCAD